MHIVDTSIFMSLKKINNASRDPRVDAATPTPNFLSLTFFFILLMSLLRYSMYSYSYCSVSYLYMLLPVRASSRPWAQILTPILPLIS